MRLVATQARFWVKLAKGRFCNPQSFQHRTRSSTRAWPRWRHSRAEASKSSAFAFVMKHVCRKPSDGQVGGKGADRGPVTGGGRGLCGRRGLGLTATRATWCGQGT